MTTSGRRVSDAVLVVTAARNDASAPRFGLSVGKRVGNAVERNRLKRRLREALRALAVNGGWDVVVAAMPPDVPRNSRRSRPTFLPAWSASSSIRASTCFCWSVCGTGMYSPFEIIRVGTGERRQHAHQRRLAGAVGPEDGEDHPARHGEIDAVDGAERSERLDQTARGNRRRLRKGGQLSYRG